MIKFDSKQLKDTVWAQFDSKQLKDTVWAQLTLSSWKPLYEYNRATEEIS